MTSDTPYAKHELQTRSYASPSSSKMIGQIIFHSPLNKQNASSREFQEGSIKQIRMKTFAPTIDGRLDKVNRNRLNMFNQPNGDQTQSISIKTPPLIESATRHGKTPYSYNTSWIDHPPENTSLHPIKSESYFTSFLSAPNAIIDMQRRTKSSLSKYETIRRNEEHFQEYVKQVDEKIASAHNKNMEDIRAQRKLHLEALEVRNRVEKID